MRPKTFTKRDIKFLLSKDNLFARKFDNNVDLDIINTIKLNLNKIKNTTLSKKNLYNNDKTKLTSTIELINYDIDKMIFRPRVPNYITTSNCRLKTGE